MLVIAMIPLVPIVVWALVPFILFTIFASVFIITD